MSTLGLKFSEETRRKMSEVQKAIGNRPPSHKGVVRSSEVRARMSTAQKLHCSMRYRKGSTAPNWKGGIYPENRRWRNSKEFKQWREAVFSRDDWTCQKCKVRGVHLHPHHILAFATYLELRFVVSNGLTLCRPCHMGLHKLLRKAT